MVAAVLFKFLGQKWNNLYYRCVLLECHYSTVSTCTVCPINEVGSVTLSIRRICKPKCDHDRRRWSTKLATLYTSQDKSCPYRSDEWQHWIICCTDMAAIREDGIELPFQKGSLLWKSSQPMLLRSKRLDPNIHCSLVLQQSLLIPILMHWLTTVDALVTLLTGCFTFFSGSVCLVFLFQDMSQFFWFVIHGLIPTLWLFSFLLLSSLQDIGPLTHIHT